MTKTGDSLAPEPGKVGGADTDKLAGGSIEKEYVDHTAIDYSSYDDGGGGGYGGGGGGGGGSEDVADEPTHDAAEDPSADDPAAEPEAEAPDDPLYADSDDDGDDTPVTDDFGDTEHPTKPGDPEVDEPVLEQPEQPQPPNTTVSIDVEAMTRLVAAMERAGEQIVSLQDEMRTILSGVHLDTSDTARFDQVADWIQEVLPGLRRRLAMAQDLLGEGGGGTQPTEHRPLPRPYVGDESQISTKPVQESYDAARTTAHRFGVPGDHETTRELVADLRANRHDPYYARELVHTTDPETLVRAVVHAGDDELAQLTAATVATAARGTGELAPPAGYEEQWAALRESDDPAVAAAAEQLRPA
ncbi:hypothetical protein E1262_13025 [Jiangella aurantiaca]|uniref:Uncharacterized protein n=1 Tax=Jiangella aurantiaca TaxID=2530373 RepID=A0A4R5AEH6_9ACTN|nr:hypothetical protein [Jiangella aurantiaca]TDD69244.1 hypothetical protein E1262_13025 [Jiangella aurantiaca]